MSLKHWVLHLAHVRPDPLFPSVFCFVTLFLQEFVAVLPKYNAQDLTQYLEFCQEGGGLGLQGARYKKGVVGSLWL